MFTRINRVSVLLLSLVASVSLACASGLSTDVDHNPVSPVVNAAPIGADNAIENAIDFLGVIHQELFQAVLASDNFVLSEFYRTSDAAVVDALGILNRSYMRRGLSTVKKTEFTAFAAIGRRDRYFMPSPAYRRDTALSSALVRANLAVPWRL